MAEEQRDGIKTFIPLFLIILGISYSLPSNEIPSPVERMIPRIVFSAACMFLLELIKLYENHQPSSPTAQNSPRNT